MVSVAALLAGALLAPLLGWWLWLGRRPRAAQLAAAALLSYPAARALVEAASASPRLTRYNVLLPASPEALWRGVLEDVGLGLLLPLAGALLLWRGLAGSGAARSLGDLHEALARVLEPAGLRLGAPARPALLDALALLGLGLALLGLALAAQGWVVPFLVTADESRYWANLSAPLLVALGLSAALSEEFVWRGAVLRALLRRMGPWHAIAVQSLLFGFIHAGYGNWAHVLGPALFGGLLGLVALRVSLLAAMVAHAGVDMAYLALAAPHLQPAILALPAALLLGGAVAAIATRASPVRALLGLRAGGSGVP